MAAFSLLIVLHEGGHFLFAKLFKIRVEKFYLFFDFPVVAPRPQFAFLAYRKHKLSLLRYVSIKKLESADGASEEKKNTPDEYKMDAFSVVLVKDGKVSFCQWERDLQVQYEAESDDPNYATEYGIGWLPLGGYVNITGMVDESHQQLAAEAKPWEFRTKPAWQRLLVMLGGILVNFITAFVIYIGVLFAWGESYIKPTDITNGLKFSEAAKADGFRDGDIIIETDGQPVKSWSVNVLRDIANSKEVTVVREGKQVVLPMPDGMNMLDMAQSNPPYADMLLPMLVDSIVPGTPAETIGLAKGDKITALNGQPVADFNDLIYGFAALKEPLNENSTAADSTRQRTVTLVVARADQESTDTLQATLTPEFTLGFTNHTPDYRITQVDYNVLECIPAGVAYGRNKLSSYVSDLRYLFSADGAKSVSGVIGITNIFPDVWDWQRFWLLTALLSIALGVMNLLPIPALDGGHAVFAIFEIITRRKPSDKFLERAQYVGFAFIIALLILATWNDISRLLQ